MINVTAGTDRDDDGLRSSFEDGAVADGHHNTDVDNTATRCDESKTDNQLRYVHLVGQAPGDSASARFQWAHDIRPADHDWDTWEVSVGTWTSDGTVTDAGAAFAGTVDVTFDTSTLTTGNVDHTDPASGCGA